MNPYWEHVSGSAFVCVYITDDIKKSFMHTQTHIMNTICVNYKITSIVDYCGRFFLTRVNSNPTRYIIADSRVRNMTGDPSFT